MLQTTTRQRTTYKVYNTQQQNGIKHRRSVEISANRETNIQKQTVIIARIFDKMNNKKYFVQQYEIYEMTEKRRAIAKTFPTLNVCFIILYLISFVIYINSDKIKRKILNETGRMGVYKYNAFKLNFIFSHALQVSVIQVFCSPDDTFYPLITLLFFCSFHLLSPRCA